MRFALGVLALCLTAPLVGRGQTTTPAGEATPRPSFSEWMDDLRRDALARGIRQQTVDEALTGITEPLPVVIRRDRAQAETVLAIEKYITRQMTTVKIRDGRQLVAAQRSTIDAVAAQYGVPASILAGVWGMESNFGRFSGVRPTVTALATLAWDPRRATFFREELFKALTILDRGDIRVAEMRGSWAGAMGQPQFMPSSYLEFAVDYNNDGRRDIWSTSGDIFASIANYLRGRGWQENQTWGREVRVPVDAFQKISATMARREGTCRATRDMTVPLPLSEWQKLGVRTMSGDPLPDQTIEASLVAGDSRRFLVYPSYDALLDYNCAQAYALTVALLGEQVTRPAPPTAAKPAPKPAPKPAAKKPAKPAAKKSTTSRH